MLDAHALETHAKRAQLHAEPRVLRPLHVAVAVAVHVVRTLADAVRLVETCVALLARGRIAVAIATLVVQVVRRELGRAGATATTTACRQGRRTTGTARTTHSSNTAS